MPNLLQRLFDGPPPQPAEPEPWTIIDSLIGAVLLAGVVGVAVGLWRSDTESGFIAGVAVLVIGLLVIIAANSQRDR